MEIKTSLNQSMKKDTGKSATYLQTAEFYSFQNKYISSSCPPDFASAHKSIQLLYCIFRRNAILSKKTGVTI
jgi:hypothetical protein